MKLTNYLGYAGLIPFIVLPFLYRQQLGFTPEHLLNLYQIYSALILGFMAGVIWPVLYLPKPTSRYRQLALIAVLFPVLSILILTFGSSYFLLLQVLLFILLRLVEYATSINQQYDKSYRQLRNLLTLGVSLSHLFMYWLSQ